MEPTLETVPFTAWEQAVFVALFIVMVIGLLRWFSKQQEVWQDFIDKQNDRWQLAIREQTLQWGLTVKEQNIQWGLAFREQTLQWQVWLKDQNSIHAVSLETVSAALDKLTHELEKHDERSNARFLESIQLARKINGFKQENPDFNPGINPKEL